MACCCSAPAGALTIHDAFSEAIRGNATLQAAREGARYRHEEVPLAHSAWLPTVRIGTGTAWTRTRTNHSNPILDGTTESRDRSTELSYVQNLFASGRDTALLHRARKEVKRVHASVEDTEQTVLLNVATYYLDTIRARRVVALRQASLAAFEARTRETRAQFRAGDRTRADVAQADAERLAAAAALTGARSDLEIQRGLFETAVGAPADNLEPAGEPVGLPANLDEARAAALDAHPAILAAGYAVAAAGHSVSAIGAEAGPRLDLRASIKWIETEVSPGFLLRDSRSRAMSAGIQVTMPLYEAGSISVRLRQARRLRERARNELQAVRREVIQRVASAWNRLSAARQRRAAYRAAVEASRVALAGVRREAEIGERTIREVLDAERELVSRQVSALSAERDAVVSAYSLLEATGRLTARSIGLTGAPDLEREARETRWRLEPGILSVGGE